MRMAIETWGLTKKFRSVVAVNNVYLRLPRGRIHILLGPEGAGKTTLLKLLLGFQKPSSGGGFCLGYDIVSESIDLRERLGYVSGDMALYGFMTVREIVSFTRNFFSYWDEQLVEHYLDLFALPHRWPIRKLEHTRRIQLALVLALAHRPGLLLLDEPTIHFPRSPEVEAFYEVLVSEQAQKEMTVLLATRNPDEIRMAPGETSLIYRGRLLKSCMTREEFCFDELPADVEEFCLHHLSEGDKT